MATALKRPEASRHHGEGKRRARRTAFPLLGLFLALGTLLAVRLSGDWHETQLREAYLPQLEAMARRAPSDGPLLALLGGRLAEAGEYPVAVETFRRALVAGDQDDEVWLMMAAARAAGGDVRYAKADFALALRAHPQSPALQVAQIRIRVLGRRPAPDALARALCPDGPSPLVASLTRGSRLNGLSEWWGRRHPEASGFATREDWARQHPEDAEAQRLWGQALLTNRRLPEATAALKRAVALAPGSADTNLALADLLERAGVPSEAVVGYVSCLKLRPDWLPALLGMGRATSDAGMTKYALQAYQRATEIAPGSADAWVGFGRAGATLWTHHAQSLAAFQAAARLAPDRTDFYTDYASALVEDGRLNAGGTDRVTAATALLRRRIAVAPDDARAHYLLGSVILNGPASPTMDADAEAETHRALALAPNQPQAEVQLAKMLLNRGDAHGAISLLTQVLPFDPGNAPAMTLLAQAYGRDGQSGLADKTLAQARQLADMKDRIQKLQDKEETHLMDAALHAQLAALYRQTGRPDKADAEQNVARLIRTNPQQAAAQMSAVKTLFQTVLKPR
jgi:tetratricopeptide (TPR) repeat protein